MVYVIVDSEKPDSVMLAKANSQEDVCERLQLRPTERVIGKFTSSEMQALDSALFAVIAG